MQRVTSLTEIGICQLDKVLAIFPHPDDESVFAAGFLAKCSSEGVPVHLICVTRGGASTHTYGLDKGTVLSETRSIELRKAMKILGISDVRLGNIPDGGIEDHIQDTESLLQKHIESYKPSIVLTLEPDGIYGHPDHVALTNVVSRLQSQYDYRLIYATVPEDYKPSENSLKMAKDPSRIKAIAPNVRLQLSYTQTLKKILALRAHKSQFYVNLAFIRKWHKRKMLRNEWLFVK